jgi:ABC-type transport system involved in multi-copper enzyme maturation permease subunit
MLATLVFEREPIVLHDLLTRVDRPGELVAWCQNAGGFAALGLLSFGTIWSLWMRHEKHAVPGWLQACFRLGMLGSGAAYLVYFLVLIFPNLLGGGKQPIANRLVWQGLTAHGLVLAVAGGLAMLTCSLPFFANLVRLRPRRIFAIAKLSFKEAIRRRVLYVFSLVLLVFLFASWFVPYKPEDQVRIYVSLVYYAMTPLLLFTAIVLASFSIPADIKNQTIHTVLTKPVERFEVVLGRLLGYVALMTMVLFVMTSVSLLYVLRGVDPEAADESLKAREPLYGELTYLNTSNERRGDSVGREWDYRGYITAPVAGQKQQTAVWTFPAVSSSVAERPMVRSEFAFDVYRTTKGKENRGVSCNFAFQTWKFQFHARFDSLQVERYRAERDRLINAERTKENPRSDLEIDNDLAEKYGYYEVRSKDVTDYHTQTLDLPGGLFRNAMGDLKESDLTEAERKAQREGKVEPAALKASTHKNAAVMVNVTCESLTQYVGMARHDLYLRLDDPNGKADALWFAFNFFKGAAGLWFCLVLVLALSVALSTYFSGVISMLLVQLLFLGGKTQEFIQSVAEGKNVGGGPLESLYRIGARQTVGAPVDASGTATSLIKSDVVSRWLIRRLLDIIPDVDRFDLTSYVAEGFNISSGQLAVNLVLLVLYLFPWALLAYYLMKWREIASST